jgi:hypothetical protein
VRVWKGFTLCHGAIASEPLNTLLEQVHLGAVLCRVRVWKGFTLCHGAIASEPLNTLLEQVHLGAVPCRGPAFPCLVLSCLVFSLCDNLKV